MKKLNFKKITSIAMGAAVGTVVANGANTLVSNLTKTMEPKTGAIARAIGLVVLGTVGPDMLGQKGDLASTAGAVIAGKGVEQILKIVMPSIVSGPDDMEVIEGDEDMTGLAGLGEYVVEGPDSENLSGPEDNVAGTY